MALLQLSLTSPELLKSILRRADDAAASAEWGLDGAAGGDGAGGASAASPSSSLFPALCRLYVAAIAPAPPSHLVAPCDVAALLLRAASLEPWAAHPSALTQGACTKMLLRRVLESDALACLVSYTVVVREPRG